MQEFRSSKNLNGTGRGLFLGRGGEGSSSIPVTSHVVRVKRNRIGENSFLKVKVNGRS